MINLHLKIRSSIRIISSFLGIFFGLLVVAAHAQTGGNVHLPFLANYDSVIVKYIRLEGNKKTKERIILRELSLVPGTKLPMADLSEILQTERNKIFNTNLFIAAEVIPETVQKDTIDVKVKVLERWYFWPFPLFELADRNFNEWWNNRGRDLSRVNYGIYFTQRNFRGRNELVKSRIQFGFTRRFELQYRIPFLDKKQSWGMLNTFSYEENKVTDYASVGNRGQDTSFNEEIMRKRMFYETEISKRLGFYDFHSLALRFERNQINPFIRDLNPDFLLDGRTQQRFFSLSYNFRRDRRNFQRYALKGDYFDFLISKIGLGIFNDVNLVLAEGTYARFRQVGTDLYWSSLVSGKVSTPYEQPYRINRAMGYGKLIIRGFDNYIVEGESIGVLKNELKWQAVNTKINLNKIIRWKQFNAIPLEIYPKVFFDVGYIENSNRSLVEKFGNERLTNRWLWGAGIGFDVVTFYASILRFEYSYNPLDEKAGLFFYYEIDL